MSIRDRFGKTVNFVKSKFIGEQNVKRRTRLLMYFIFLFLIAAFVIFSLLEKNYPVMIADIAFCVLNVVNIILILKARQGGMHVAGFLFILELGVLLLFFLISGNPEGFSAIWLILFPFGAMIDHGLKKGFAYSAGVWAVIVILLWTPLREIVLMEEALSNYTKTFYVEFPIVYLLAIGFAVFLEVEKECSNVDPLTKLNNRTGFWAELMLLDFRKHGDICFGVFDVDNFKHINDVNGHHGGDKVLSDIGAVIGKEYRRHFARWGGDEFVFWFRKDENYMELIDEWMKKVEEHTGREGKDVVKFTVSVGICETPCRDYWDVRDHVLSADQALYRAKENGKNQVVVYKKQ